MENTKKGPSRPRVVVHVSTINVRPDAASETLPSECCGVTTEEGFGLAGGGFGPYVICAGECGRIYKDPKTAEDPNYE